MNNFKALRIMAGMTQKQVGDALGVSPVSVHQWETGKCNPNAIRLRKLAKLYGCNVEDLFAKEDRMSLRECESKLLALAEQMRDVYREYHPEDEWLSMSVINNQLCISGYGMSDGHADVEKKILDVVKFEDGHVRDTEYWRAAYV